MLVPFICILSINVLIALKMRKLRQISIRYHYNNNVETAPSSSIRIKRKFRQEPTSKSLSLSRKELSTQNVSSFDLAEIIDARKLKLLSLERQETTSKRIFRRNAKASNVYNYRRRFNMINKYMRTTRILFIISVSFFLMHTPTALLKCWYIVKALIIDDVDDRLKTIQNNSTLDNEYYLINETKPLEELIERITCYIYYLHYSLNFFLYVLNMRKFRKKLLELINWRIKFKLRHPNLTYISKKN